MVKKKKCLRVSKVKRTGRSPCRRQGRSVGHYEKTEGTFFRSNEGDILTLLK